MNLRIIAVALLMAGSLLAVVPLATAGPPGQPIICRNSGASCVTIRGDSHHPTEVCSGTGDAYSCVGFNGILCSYYPADVEQQDNFYKPAFCVVSLFQGGHVACVEHRQYTGGENYLACVL